MKNRIIKYTKFIISVVLIAGLIAPSYASLSASDGSAFVTKAEFDSALADFNARLTTFEAGINSKIDSQVTSYLDRNGIWNGKDQALDDPVLCGTLTKARCKALTKAYDGEYYMDNGGERVIVNNLSKSGMLYAVISLEKVVAPTYIESASQDDTWTALTCIYLGNATDRLTSVTCGGSVSGPFVAGASFYWRAFSIPNANFSLLCFVQKDTPLTGGLIMLPCGRQSKNMATCTYGWTLPSGDVCIVKSCKVY